MSNFLSTVKDTTVTDTTMPQTGLSNMTIYYWRVSAQNVAGNRGWDTAVFITIPLSVVLHTGVQAGAYQLTCREKELSYSVPVQCDITLNVYDLRGQKVFSIHGTRDAGIYSIPNDWSNGLYCVEFHAGSFVTRQLIR